MTILHQQDIELRQLQYWAALSTSDLCSYLWNEIRSLASNDFEQFDNICRWWNQCCYLKISNVLHFRLKTIINFVNLSPLLPPALYSNKQPDDPLIYARLHQHRQLVDQIFIDFSTDFTSSTSSLARHVAGLGFFLCWFCHYKFVQIFSLNVKYFLSTKPFKASLLRRFVNNVLHSSSVQGCLLVYLRVSVSLWTPSRILQLSDQPCTKFGRTVLNSDPNW